MIATERLTDLVSSILVEYGADLYDIEQTGGVSRFLIDRPGGVDIDTLGKITRKLSNLLDEVDEFADRELLEVSSPGIERPLRLPRHFISVIGQKVKIKTSSGTEGERRYEGVLVSADESGFALENASESRHFEYHQVERANTVFEWDSGETKTDKKPWEPKTRKVAKT